MDFGIQSKEVQAERELLGRLRGAIEFCIDDRKLMVDDDLSMDKGQRMEMEQCLVKNYLLKHGLDYFGKRDLIYIDMKGTRNVKAHF